MEELYNLIAKVPTWLWIVIGICIVVPMVGVAIKKSMKLLGIAAIVIALLFMFPSIGSAVMDRIGITYDAETHSIINRDGTRISIDSISDLIDAKEKLEGVGDELDKIMSESFGDAESTVNDSKGATLSLSELQKEIDNLIEVQGGDPTPQDKKMDVLGEEITITKSIIKNAKKLGLNIDKDTKIVSRAHKYYMILKDNSEIELSADLVKSLGIK